jgi:hypothetical protein
MVMTVSTRPFTGTFAVDPVHSSVEFAVQHMGVSLFRARFEEEDARDLEKRIETGAAIFGTSTAGGTFVPINP